MNFLSLDFLSLKFSDDKYFEVWAVYQMTARLDIS